MGAFSLGFFLVVVVVDGAGLNTSTIALADLVRIECSWIHALKRRGKRDRERERE